MGTVLTGPMFADVSYNDPHTARIGTAVLVDTSITAESYNTIKGTFFVDLAPQDLGVGFNMFAPFIGGQGADVTATVIKAPKAFAGVTIGETKNIGTIKPSIFQEAILGLPIKLKVSAGPNTFSSLLLSVLHD